MGQIFYDWKPHKFSSGTFKWSAYDRQTDRFTHRQNEAPKKAYIIVP